MRTAVATVGLATLAAGVGGGSYPASAAADDLVNYTCTSSEAAFSGPWTVEADLGIYPLPVAGGDLSIDSSAMYLKSSPALADELRKRYDPTEFEISNDLTYQIGDKTGHTKIVVDGSNPFPEEGKGLSYSAELTFSDTPQAPEVPGAYDLTIENMTMNVKLSHDGTTTDLAFDCAPAAGANNVLYPIEVQPAATSASPGSDSPTTSTSTVSGPPVETGVSRDDTNSGAVALGILGVGGVAALTAAARRRLRD
ncbi:hypothetical protein [Demetria terragena]|uniref:hypothetical protein n=1 Tax=Demetria terragena TaxID=63959 RepID=UPI00037DB681|nr:hypothetical protein [Demetria terragena]